MESVQVTKAGTVKLRGIHLPVEQVRAAMLETGGVPVSDRELNSILDNALTSHFASSDEKPNSLTIEAIPDRWFIPIKIKLHLPGDNTSPDCWLYFAVQKKTIFNA